MSAKILQSWSDANPDFKKQLGCMSGIFQLFDRNHIISSKRIHAHKRLPPRASGTNSINSGVEALTSPQTSVEKIAGRYAIEHERVSVESSTTSVSSTSFSSFSSLEYHKARQLEAPSSTPLRASKFQSSEYSNAKNSAGHHDHSSTTTLPGRQFHGSWEVKDSNLREPHGLSVKTKIKEDYINTVFKDSPRPLQLSRSLDGGAGGTRKPKLALDLNESSRVLAKLKEGPWHASEVREPARAYCEAKRGSYAPSAKEFPRFSYDSRELSRSSFDSSEASKMSSKVPELPRLSLDSRQTSMRNSYSDLKLNASSKRLHAANNQDIAICNRSSSVVAKLMGLEPLPGSKQTDEKKMGAANSSRPGSFCSERNGNMSPGNLRMNETPRLERCSNSPRRTLSENPSPRARNSYPVIKPNLPPKFPIEAAPWKQKESGGAAKKLATKHSEVASRQPTSLSVFSEIEKRLNDLDFKQSHKDLRVLKQIIEAMQAKRQFGRKKEEHETTTYASVRKSNVKTPQSKNSNSLSTKGIGSPRARESPIVIIKPAKLVEKSGSPQSSLIPIDGLPGIYKSKSVDASAIQRLSNNRIDKDRETRLHLRGSRSLVHSAEEKTIVGKNEETRSPRLRLKPMQSSSPRNQISPKEKNAKSSNTSSSSPRDQQRKAEMERKFRSPVPSPELNKPTRRHLGRQFELGSPGARRGDRSTQSDDNSSEKRSDTGYFNHGGDEISVVSDSSASFLSQADTEVISADRSAVLIASLQRKNSFSSPGEDGMGFSTVAPEQPSPVSVLDASLYREDFMPSPVKYLSNTFGDMDGCILEEAFGEDALDDQSSKMKLQKVQLLTLKPTQLNAGHVGTYTDHIGPLPKDTNPDHSYVSDILLASGLLLIDFKSYSAPVQVPLSEHVINPDLFLVLEQVKTSSVIVATENGPHEEPSLKKQHRKLVFDTVNEVLAGKLALARQAEPWLQFQSLTSFIPDGRSLLKEICFELDQLCPSKVECVGEEDEDWLENMLAADVMHREERWTDFDKQIPHVVLDIERLIFKGLIDEIVSKEASTLHVKPSSRRRQIFSG